MPDALRSLHTPGTAQSDDAAPPRGLVRLARLVPGRVSILRSLSNAESSAASQDAMSALSPALQHSLSSSDVAAAMQLWNKALAFPGALAEALALRWRVECVHDLTLETRSVTAAREALAAVEKNEDPLAHALGARLDDLPDMVLRLLDAAVRAAAPDTQTVQREAYRALSDRCVLARARVNGAAMSLECESVADYSRLLAACGVPARSAVALVRAALWALATHVPYAQAEDLDDVASGLEGSAIGAVIAQHAAVPLLAEVRKRVARASDPVFTSHLPGVWRAFSEEDRSQFGECFYRRLLTLHPDLLDFFSRCDMDALAYHLASSLDFIFQSSLDPMGRSSFRSTLEQLAELHLRMSVPTRSYPLMGAALAEAFQPHFERAEKANRSGPDAAALRAALVAQYRDVMSIMHFPMNRQERLLDSARDFLKQVSVELGWTDAQLNDRVVSVETEVIATGTYTHTADELRVGARLAWRNSVKCIGRIAWNTLEVRDCRHVDNPDGIFKEVCEHLRIATAGTNIQSVMTVFKPQGQNEALGTRFWSSQLHRFAAYKDEHTGEILGDSANLELTSYLVTNKMWTPPKPRTGFDVLPLVMKCSGRERPYVYEIPTDLLFEVSVEHPTNEKISALGYKWCTVPAITNFKMTLGGVTYQNMPFNGWFMSTEIARNLMERYDSGPAVAAACGIDTGKDNFWRQQVALELERAIIYSFNKNGYTIVDPMTAGQSFLTHVKREREQFGRECPAQWSWIGGLVGPTNPTWHLEMRDFLVNPQYEYCVDGLKLFTADQENQAMAADESAESASNVDKHVVVPRLLITYGSETGNAESTARLLKRELRALKPILRSLNDVAGLSIAETKKLTHVLCVCSTFGDGEPPSNADFFFEKGIIPLSGVKFAVLGLGSTIYPNFCKAGVTLDKKLEVAGLERLCTLTKADEAAGSEGVIQRWIKLMKTLVLTPSVEKQLADRLKQHGDDNIIHQIKWMTSQEKPAAEQNQGALCLSNEQLLTEIGEAEGSARKITFEAPSAYVTGDHISVQPVNSDRNAAALLRCFEDELRNAVSDVLPKKTPTDGNILSLASMMHFRLESVEEGEAVPADVFFVMPTTLGHLMQYKLDLSFNPTNVVDILTIVKGLLDELFIKIGNARKASILTGNSLFTDLSKYCEKVLNDDPAIKSVTVDELTSMFPTIAAFLGHFSSVLFDPISDTSGVAIRQGPLLKLADMLCAMHRLQPRYYSISSSSSVSPENITISVGVLRSKTSKGAEIHGVCSNYLSSLIPGKDRARIAVRTSTFRLPRDHSKPIILVGAGTGLSPLMGFLEDRAMGKKAMQQSDVVACGDVKLFYGCRTRKHFMYKDIIMEHERNEVTKVHLALSRPPDGKKQYVQDRIAAEEEMMGELLIRDDVHYYVCGDARMAESCFEQCVGVLRRKARMSRVSAVRYLKRLRAERRWQTDVWGIVSNQEEAKKAIEKSRRAAAQAWMATFQDE